MSGLMHVIPSSDGEVEPAHCLYCPRSTYNVEHTFFLMTKDALAWINRRGNRRVFPRLLSSKRCSEGKQLEPPRRESSFKIKGDLDRLQ
ncbi:uncharacterized protein isoform X2 [Rhodnius prolixus]|uniref:uncharacterized protein isoform X2 n=1 Tax=Rhodnius prolixus TaxID=13249 RepID=UPI003D18D9F5